MVQRFVRKGIDVNSYTDVFPPLTVAAKNGYLEIVKMLLAAGADVRVKSRVSERGTRYERTALHEACYSKCLELVTLLVEAGADVNAVDAFGETPVHYTCTQLYSPDTLLGDEFRLWEDEVSSQILLFLISKSANINAKNYWGRRDAVFQFYDNFWFGLLNDGHITPLHAVCRAGMHKCLQVLLSFGKKQLLLTLYLTFNRRVLMLLINVTSGAKFTHMGSFRIINKRGKMYSPDMNNPIDAFACILLDEYCKIFSWGDEYSYDRNVYFQMRNTLRKWLNYRDLRHLLLIVWNHSFSSTHQSSSCSSTIRRKGVAASSATAVFAISPILKIIGSFLMFDLRACNTNILLSVEVHKLLS